MPNSFGQVRLVNNGSEAAIVRIRDRIIHVLHPTEEVWTNDYAGLNFSGGEVEITKFVGDPELPPSKYGRD